MYVYMYAGQRNCPNHVEFYSKNKFENLGHLICFIIRIYHDALSRERQICVILCNGYEEGVGYAAPLTKYE